MKILEKKAKTAGIRFCPITIAGDETSENIPYLTEFLVQKQEPSGCFQVQDLMIREVSSWI